MKKPHLPNLTAENAQEILSYWESLSSTSISISIWAGFKVSIYYENGELGVIGDWEGVPLQGVRVRAYQGDPNDHSLDFSVPGLSPYPASGLKASFRMTQVVRPTDHFYHDKGQVIMCYYFWDKTADVFGCAVPKTGDLDSSCWQGISLPHGHNSKDWQKVGVLHI